MFIPVLQLIRTLLLCPQAIICLQIEYICTVPEKKKVKKIKNTLSIYKMTVQQEQETLHHRVTRQTLFCNPQGKSP